MYALGRYYDGGGGIPKSFDEAIVVSQKGPRSMSHGIQSSIVQNFNESIKWFKLAANKGHVGAQIDLGHSYYWSTLKDTAESFRWYKLAAESGNPIAQFELAFRFYYRDTTKEGRAKTLQLLNASAEQDYPDAQKQLGHIYKEGHLLLQDHEKSFDWFCRANQNNNNYANFEIGYCYYHGLGVDRNIDEAKSWLELGGDYCCDKSRVLLEEIRKHGN